MVHEPMVARRETQRENDSLAERPPIRGTLEQGATAHRDTCRRGGRPPWDPAGRRGRRGMELATIVEGQARIIEGCRETMLLGPGEFFGVISPLDGGAYWATVEAASGMRVLEAGERALSRLLQVRPCLTLRIMSGLSRHARRQDELADRSLHKGSKPLLTLRAGRYP